MSYELDEGVKNYAYHEDSNDLESQKQTSFCTTTSSRPSSTSECDLDDFKVDLLKDYDEVPKKERNLVYWLVFPLIGLIRLLKRHSKTSKLLFTIAFVIGYVIFTGFAIKRNFGESLILIVLGCLTVGFITWDWLMAKYKHKINVDEIVSSKLFIALKWIIGIGVVGAIIGFLIYDIFFGKIIKLDNLVGFAGLLFYTIVCILLSVAPYKIRWRPVLWGYGIQLVLGMFVLRTNAGLVAFQWLGDQIALFLSYTDSGSQFVFGGATGDISSFAFGVLPIIIFFSMIISMLYYVGFMPYIIGKISWLMEISCDTTGPESTACAGNIFVGMTESPLLIKPFINDLTKSETLCVMVSGFASIAGSVMGAYIKMGISPSDLITASVMSAPGALAMSKLLYPELQKSRFRGDMRKEPEKMEAQNIVEAASNGASMAIPLVANIAAMLIAFVAFIEWLNAAVAWGGECVGQDNWSFNLLLAYIFYPFVYLMGISPQEVLAASNLVGQKTVFNEFIAFTELGKMIEYRQAGYPRCDCSGTIQWLSERSETLVVYALSGFSNIGAMGIMLGGMNGIAPKRAKTFSEIVVLALFGGIMACFSRACITSILYEQSGSFLWGENKFNIDYNCTYTDNTIGNGCEVICDGQVISPPSGDDCTIYDKLLTSPN